MKSLFLTRIELVLYVCLFTLNGWAQSIGPPSIEAEGEQYYCPLSIIQVVTNFNISGPDDLIIDEFYIQISSGYVNGDILELVDHDAEINSSWDALTGKLTISKSGGPLSYQDITDAVKHIVYQGNDPEFSGEKFFSFTLGNANFLPSTGHFYEYIPDRGILWTQAKILAEQREYYGLPGYLATITSREEAQLTGEQADGAGWIGGSDAETEGTWKWVTGPETGDIFWKGDFNGTAPSGAFEFWNTGEPNNLGEEDYAHVTAPNIGVRGSWNDLPNQGSTGDYEPKGYLVEYGYEGPDDAPDFSAFSSIYSHGIDSTFSSSRCGPGVVALSATLQDSDHPQSKAGIFWFTSETDMSPVWTGPVYEVDLSETTTFYVLASADGCFAGKRHPVTGTVHQIPVIEKEVTLKNCDQDNNPTDGYTDFNLNEANELILKNTQTEELKSLLPPPIVTIAYYASEAEAAASLNPLNPFPFNNQTADHVFARVENTESGCSDIARVNLVVSATEPVELVILESCDTYEDNDGIYAFDLTQATESILAQLPPQDLRVQYYHSQEEALLEQNEILPQTGFVNEVPYYQTLFVRIESQENGDCISLGKFVELYVYELPEFFVSTEVIYCREQDPVELSIFNPRGTYSYQWKDPSGDVISQEQSVFVDTAGNYKVTAISDLNCVSVERFVSVRESSLAEISEDDITVVDGVESNSITIDPLQLGEGVYEYALDSRNGPFKAEPFFSDVIPGEHSLFIRDQLGCGTAEIQVSVIGYPAFFTPNGDGFNDTWQVQGISGQPGTRILIYNKFGKLLAELDGSSDGWNGYFNGAALPSTDYWYRVKLEDGRLKTGHFSLIRR